MADTPNSLRLVMPQSLQAVTPGTGKLSDVYTHLVDAMVKRINELEARVAQLEAIVLAPSSPP